MIDFRKVDEMFAERAFTETLILLAAFLVLFIVEPYLVRRSVGLQTAYYLVQATAPTTATVIGTGTIGMSWDVHGMSL